jgi:glutathione reductase (NADPH)
MEERFDYIVIGAGSGGVASARRAASYGARVAIIEGRRVGGTCVLRGCVPKKLLMYAAQYRDGLAEARHYGWSVGKERFDMARWQAAKTAETQRLEGVYRKLLADAGVTLVEGQARFAGAHAVAVGQRTLTAPHICIAAGAVPVRDSIAGIAECPTSDDLLDLTAIPSEATIIGGGYIAVEFAGMLARLGAKVHLRFRDRLPLRGFDEDLRTRLAAALAAAGVELHAGGVPATVARARSGFELALHDGRRLATPWVLNATGRQPNTAALGLDRIGLKPDAQGVIPIDAALRTKAAGVYAIGDVTSRKNLTPVAVAEGRALADSLFGPQARTVDLSLVASAVFTLPPLATIGLTEQQAVQDGQRVKVFEADFRPMKQAFYGGQERSYMKLVVDDATDRVAGVHMIGADAPEIVQSLAVALTAGATKADFDRTMAVHPTAAEEFMLMRLPARIVGKLPLRA